MRKKQLPLPADEFEKAQGRFLEFNLPPPDPSWSRGSIEEYAAFHNLDGRKKSNPADRLLRGPNRPPRPTPCDQFQATFFSETSQELPLLGAHVATIDADFIGRFLQIEIRDAEDGSTLRGLVSGSSSISSILVVTNPGHPSPTRIRYSGIHVFSHRIHYTYDNAMPLMHRLGLEFSDCEVL